MPRSGWPVRARSSALRQSTADGSPLNREEYLPYGETAFGSVTLKRYRFTGKERDEESGLNYHSARYYAAWTSRWLSVDPRPSPPGSAYAYCAGSPMILADRGGRTPAIAGNEPQNKASSGDVRTGASAPRSDQAHESLAPDSASPDPQTQDPGPQTAGSGADTVYNTAKRSEYLSKVSANSAEGVQRVQAARSAGDIQAAEAAARETSATRNVLRTATQKKLLPGSKLMSKTLDQARDFESLAQKYAQPNQFDTFEEIALAAGRSRPSVTALTNFGKVAGPVALLVGVGVGGYAVTEARPADRPRVAAREVGGVVGGAAGAELGVAGGTGVAVLIAVAAGLSGPPGWLVLGLGVLGGFGGGYFGSKGGRAGGEALYDAARGEARHLP